MTFTKWSQIRDEQIERIGREEFEAGKEQMLAEARGWRLAEIRRRRGQEPNQEPTTTVTRPHPAAWSHDRRGRVACRATCSYMQPRRSRALQVRGRWFDRSCAHQPEHFLGDLENRG